jgi:hypothetical protein
MYIVAALMGAFLCSLFGIECIDGSCKQTSTEAMVVFIAGFVLFMSVIVILAVASICSCIAT